MRIVELSLENIENIGEELLGDTTEYLIKEVETSAEVIRQQMILSTSEMLHSRPISAGMYLGLRMIGKYSTSSKIKFVSDRIAFRLKLRKYFKNILKSADAVIVACGMFKYSIQNFNQVFEILTEVTDSYHIPVLFSGMSIQTVNNDDYRCRQLKNCLKAESLKMFTTRDGQEGLRRLKEEYRLPSTVKCLSVGDPALWIKECYNISAKKKNVIGIGLVRKGVFADYGNEVTESQVDSFYWDLINTFNEKGIEWQFFTNGMSADYEYGKRLLKQFGLSEDKLVSRPKNAKEYFDTMTGYKAIMGARLHACISAVALGIPVVGLSWDDKFKYFSHSIGIEDNFLDIEGMDGKKAAELLECLIDFKYDEATVNKLKESMLQSIRKFIREFVY